MKLFLNKILYICLFFIFASSSCARDVSHVGNQELKQLIQQGVAVVDVRTTFEWKKTGVLEGSHLIMFYDEKGKYDMNAWLEDVAAIAKKDEPVILICHSGGRSKTLANYLVKEIGYETVYNVKHGIVSWIKEKNPTVAP